MFPKAKMQSFRKRKSCGVGKIVLAERVFLWYNISRILCALFKSINNTGRENMKTITRILALTLMTAVLLLVLASCSGSAPLDGTYKAEVFGTGTEYVFNGKTVTLHVTVAGMVAATLEGTYEIAENKITLTFGGDEDTAKQYSGMFDFSMDEEGDTIKIGIVEYSKVK